MKKKRSRNIFTFKRLKDVDLDPFGGAKRRSGSTLSKPQHLCWEVEGLT
jgi:hypothetical protein